jgi:hypothetical protein
VVVVVTCFVVTVIVRGQPSWLLSVIACLLSSQQTFVAWLLVLTLIPPVVFFNVISLHQLRLQQDQDSVFSAFGKVARVSYAALFRSITPSICILDRENALLGLSQAATFFCLGRVPRKLL